jgi:hypothetical protein
MKTFCKSILLSIAALAVVACGPTSPPSTTTTASTTTTTSTTTSTSTTSTTSTVPSGWREIWREEFNVNMAEGQFPGPYAGHLGAYPCCWPDTSGQIEGSASRYDPRILSVDNGILIKRLQVTAQGPRSSALVPEVAGLREGRYTIRWRVPNAVSGWKMAWLLWPTSEQWPRDGEVDFPEGDFDRNICAFMHRQNATQGSDQDAFCSSTPVAGAWHTTVIERTNVSIRFILDGNVIGTSTNRLPNTPMTWRVQTETCFTGCQPTQDARVEIDWLTIEVPT